jgi:hypothetical protein
MAMIRKGKIQNISDDDIGAQTIFIAGLFQKGRPPAAIGSGYSLPSPLQRNPTAFATCRGAG